MSEQKYPVVAETSAPAPVLTGTSGSCFDEVIVRYKPYAETSKWFKYRFSAWSSSRAWVSGLGLVMFLFTVGFLVFGGSIRDQGVAFFLGLFTHLFGVSLPGNGASGFLGNAGMEKAAAQVIEILFLYFAGACGVMVLRHPTHIAIGQRGIAREWRTLGGITFQQNVDWQSISGIELWQPPGTTSQHDCFIKIKSNRTTGSEYPIKLKVGAIASSDERNRFMQAIESFGGEIHRDSQLLELMAPAQNSSYTELWLQALSAPPKRERLTPLSPGSTLQDGKYEMLDQLGVGGQGTAYLAIRKADHREIVLKEFILPVYVDVNVRRQALERMQNEASMLSRLNNPRIVRLMDFFVEDHRGYLVLEKIDGPSLRVLVGSKGKLSEQTVIELARQMCDILEYLQNLTPPVVHRDFTPDNLILAKDGTLKLVDFNVAQQTESTATGTVVGKHAYIAPEQFRGKPTTASDIYSMGATLAYLITGHDPEPITCTHLKKELPEVSDRIDLIVSKSTALDTAKRYKNSAEMIDDIDRVPQQPV